MKTSLLLFYRQDLECLRVDRDYADKYNSGIQNEQILNITLLVSIFIFC